MSGLSKKAIVLANKIADRIKMLRIQYIGEKQTDFAYKYNIDKQDISRWESHVSKDVTTGKVKGRGITIYTVKRFCDLIGITLFDFFDHELFQN